ncbi:hypothetical protein AOT82_448 [Psychrobacter sp. AntiMn-1]|nr:hypothetical protein AOT82_448 [Psychrobacter sp. AntiMn-1]HBL97197.1 hypothetical protein [Psychrobacter sp.]
MKMLKSSSQDAMRKMAEDGNRIVKDITDNNQDAIFVKADVTQKSDIQAVVDSALTTYDKIDILYNGADIHDGYDNAVELEEDFYDKLMAINIKAPYLASKMVIPHLSSKVSVLLFRSQIALVVANMIVNHKKSPLLN